MSGYNPGGGGGASSLNFTKAVYSYTDFQPNATNVDEIVINIPDGNYLCHVYAYESVEFNDGAPVNVGITVSNSVNSTSESRDGLITLLVEGASSDTLTVTLTTVGFPAPAFDDMVAGEITLYYAFEEVTI